jgi:hypothetical protein
MADHQSKPKPVPVTLWVAEIHNLADRLSARADKIENLAAMDIADDMRLAARVILALVRSFNRADVVALDHGA